MQDVAKPPWCVYLLECQGGGIYVGITPDVEARLARHTAGRGSFYTRLNRPVALLGAVWVNTRRESAILERQVKKLTGSQKREWLVQCPPSCPLQPTSLTNAMEALARLLGQFR